MRERQMMLLVAKQFKKDSDIGRLTKVLETLPDDQLIKAIEKTTLVGRPLKHPVRVLWHIFIAGIVYRHHYLSKVLDEMKRNSDLREACGILRAQEVPKPYEMSRFVAKLVLHCKEVEDIFKDLVHRVKGELPDFGESLACDGKHVHTNARGKKDDPSSDKEASWGVKTKNVTASDGKTHESVFKWFGYKLHLLVDTAYELPIAFTVTSASESEKAQMMPLIKQGAQNLSGKGVEVPKDIFEDVICCADKGYDAGELYKEAHEKYKIKPLIALVEHRDPKTHEIVYERDRLTRIKNHVTGEWHDLKFLGYEKSRNALKYGCPCDGKGPCPFYGAGCNKATGGPGALFRIKLSDNYRYYTAIPRESKKWKREYKRRTAVERVNSRLAQVLEIDHSGFRGRAKVGLRCMGGLIVMLAHALHCLKSGRIDAIRSLTKSA